MTNFAIKPNDYFTTYDMKKEGESRWKDLRAELKRQGYKIGNGFGNFSVSVNDGHHVFLCSDGDLVHTKDAKVGGRLVTIAQVLDKTVIKQIKVRTGSNKTKIRLAFQYLVGLGYNDRNRNAIVDREGRMVGLIGSSDGIIYSILIEDTFSRAYADVDELLYDIETTSVLTNAHFKKKVVEVMGFKVDEETLLDFLKAQSAKSASSALFKK